MKRTYITPNFNIIGMCESEMIAGAGSMTISKDSVNKSEDIGFAKSNDIQESEGDSFWE